MKTRPFRWIVALSVSVVFHAAAAALLLPDMDEPKIEGGAPTEIALAGNAFIEEIAAGQADEAVRPVADAAEKTEPVRSSGAATRPVEAEEAQETTPHSTVLAEAAEHAETPVAQPDRTQSTPEVEPVEPTDSASAAVSDVEETQRAEIAVALQAKPSGKATVTAPAVEPARAESAEATDTSPAKAARQDDVLTPASPENSVQALADVPTPTPRPDYTPPKRSRKHSTQQREARPPTRKASGSGGRNRSDRRRGVEDGRANGKSAQDGQRTARTSAAGNAAVSNYPGKIVGKLRRALRYPAGTDQRGEAQVRFTVSRSGSVNGIRIVRSSGSPVLDEAAVATVRRAAPFPEIPAAAGRSSWAFTIPLAFVR